jgi:membrane protein implicated in regulation of membrane protease activity
METVFLICFAFGAIFTVVSVLLGAVGGGGHDGGGIHIGHELGHGAAHAHIGHVDASGHGHGDLGHDANHSGVRAQLPLLNASSLLAFLTWFGAAGFLLTRFAGWPLLLVIPVAVVAGLAAAILIALFLGKVLAGERVMNPADYRLEGTFGKLTVGIPAGGTGEVVFSKAGTRRSEAARSLSGRAIPRDSEVVIVDYERGIALVQTWDELVGNGEPSALRPGEPQAKQGA